MDETGHEVSKSYDIGIDGGVIEQDAPRPLLAGESEGAAAAGGIERIDARLANFTAKAHLVLPGGVGKRVGEMSGNIVAAGVWREAGILKSGNGDERSASKIRRSHAGVETESNGVDIAVHIRENLVEIAHAD